MTEAVKNVNNIIFPFALILIGFVILKAILFLRHALAFNKKHQLYTSGQIKDTIVSSAISTIGPAFSVVVVVLAMISIIGPTVTFMRSGVIGAADYELWMADIVASSLGVELGGEGFTEAAFTTAIFGMVLGSAPYMINLLITCKPLDKALIKASQKKRSFIPVLGLAAELGIVSYWALETGAKGVSNTAGILTGMFTAMAIIFYCKKKNSSKLNDWMLAISLVGGMAGATIVDVLMGAV